MSAPVSDLLSLLDLERIEENIFRGSSPQVGWQRVFGGLVIAQALVAASRTVEARACHSLHGYFLRPGDPAVPIVYEVDRSRDGRSFTTRRCQAIQHGKPIFILAASYQVEEPGLDHAFPMPDVPQPEELPTEEEFKKSYFEFMPEPIRRYFERERPVELRPVSHSHYFRTTEKPHPPQQQVWMRATRPLPDDPAIHRAVMAYVSDISLLDTALIAHGRSVFDGKIQSASLDHALWFHRPFRADEWLLYAQDSPSSSGARGLGRGLIFSRDGALVATVAQEGLLRDVSLRDVSET